MDSVRVSSYGPTGKPHDDVQVYFYKHTTIDQIDSSLDSGSPRAYSRLPHGIAVIQ